MFGRPSDRYNPCGAGTNKRLYSDIVILNHCDVIDTSIKISHYYYFNKQDTWHCYIFLIFLIFFKFNNFNCTLKEISQIIKMNQS